jgi:hypothetical protein
LTTGWFGLTITNDHSFFIRSSIVSDSTTPTPARTPWLRSVGLAVGLSAAVSVIVLAFSWPSVTLDPKDVPIAISGPSAAVSALEKTLDEKSDGVFAFTEVDDRAAAAHRIETREAYGAIVLGEKPEVLTSSAAGTATNQLMTQLHAQLQVAIQQQVAAAASAAGAPSAPTVTVELTDVVPLVSDDPRGAGPTATAFPLVLGGIIGGIGITFAVTGAGRRVLALLSYAVIGGLAIAGIMHGWFGVLPGNYLADAGAFSLTLLAMGATIVGFASLVGRAGVAVGPVLFMLIGNPISGSTFPKEFYPQPWGAIGQFLPPGAGGTLLRDASYFPDADPTFPILVLAIWAAAGLTLVAAGHFRNQAEVRRAAGRAEITTTPAAAAV